MQVVLFDLTNRTALEKISQKIRLPNAVVHDVVASVGDLPNGAYGAIDQVWFLGEVLSKLADMFSANMFENGTEFILDTQLTILNTAVTILTDNTDLECTITDFRDLL